MTNDDTVKLQHVSFKDELAELKANITKSIEKFARDFDVYVTVAASAGQQPYDTHVEVTLVSSTTDDIDCADDDTEDDY